MWSCHLGTKLCEEVEVQFHTFLTSVLAGRKLSPSWHGRFTSATRLYSGMDWRQKNYATVWKKDKTLVHAGNWTPFLRSSTRSITKILYSASKYDQRISGSTSAGVLKPQLTIYMFSLWLKRFVMEEIQPANAQFHCSECEGSDIFRLCSYLHSRYNKVVHWRVVFLPLCILQAHVKINKFHCTASLSGNS